MGSYTSTAMLPHILVLYSVNRPDRMDSLIRAKNSM